MPKQTHVQRLLQTVQYKHLTEIHKVGDGYNLAVVLNSGVGGCLTKHVYLTHRELEYYVDCNGDTWEGVERITIEGDSNTKPYETTLKESRLETTLTGLFRSGFYDVPIPLRDDVTKIQTEALIRLNRVMLKTDLPVDIELSNEVIEGVVEYVEDSTIKLFEDINKPYSKDKELQSRVVSHILTNVLRELYHTNDFFYFKQGD